MSICTGLEKIIENPENFPMGESPGLLCHSASVTSELTHAVDAIIGRGILLSVVFGPQHGIGGTDQANMIEWEGDRDGRTGLPIYSLYGENRRPTAEMLSGLSSMIIDLQDVGARYYTYIWTAFLCIRACSGQGIPVIIADRPNPIGGDIIEGPGIDSGFSSFVGLGDIPVRHGLTIGELLMLLATRKGISDNLHVACVEGWQRSMKWPETGLHWVNPSPNMPSYLTALVYPGGCLVEGTNLSEGRGTTRPFEYIGAPWVDAYDLAAALDAEELPAAIFRPCEFKPAFDKFAGRTCRGIQVHILDENEFRPVLTYYAIIKCVRALCPKHFRWSEPPYEYEFDKLPIDILAGSTAFRDAVENDIPATEMVALWRANEDVFKNERRGFLLY